MKSIGALPLLLMIIYMTWISRNDNLTPQSKWIALGVIFAISLIIFLQKLKRGEMRRANLIMLGGFLLLAVGSFIWL